MRMAPLTLKMRSRGESEKLVGIRLASERDAATTLAEFGVNSAVEKPSGRELLERVAASKPIARKLHAIQDAQWPVQFVL